MVIDAFDVRGLLFCRIGGEDVQKALLLLDAKASKITGAALRIVIVGNRDECIVCKTAKVAMMINDFISYHSSRLLVDGLVRAVTFARSAFSLNHS